MEDKSKKQAQHTARTGLPQRQNMPMEFWAGFKDYLASDFSTVKATAPQPQCFNNLPPRWFDIDLVAVASSVNRLHNASEPGEIHAEVAMHGDNGEMYFQAPQRQKAAIEQKCGENLNWYNKTPRKRRIFVRRDAALDDRGRWPEYFTRLQSKLEKLHQAFASRVKAIKE
ncbi:MAG: DUF4268 domain-containing protein [Candidatus Hydrogenedentales bacterium]|jgi:hypothetical protein